MSLLWVIPIQLLRRMKIRLTFYLDDILVLNQILNIILKARDTIIHILQNLGFIINQKRSVMVATTKIEFLGTMTDSVTMVLLLSSEGGIDNQSLSGSFAEKIRNCQKPGKFSFAYLSILQAPTNCKLIQMVPKRKSKEEALIGISN